MSGQSDRIICAKCDLELELRKRNLTYLGSVVSYDFLCCPKCGNIYIPQELADGKMHDLETAFEDK